ncbi:MAG: glycerophosphodiester phosphodiesterase [Candidatus Latescibacterota bacterium]
MSKPISRLPKRESTAWIVIFGLLALPAPVFAAGIAAHRGDHTAAPENTLPAFVTAVKAGVHQVELDVHSTKDGALVLMHDAAVDRTTNGNGRIADLTYKEVRAFDAGMKFDPKFAGTKIPTLREALEVIPMQVLVNVHIGGGEQTAVAAARLIWDMGRMRQCFLTIGDTQNAVGRAVRAATPGILICKGAAVEMPVTDSTFTLAADSAGLSPRIAKERVDYVQFYQRKPEMPPIEQLRESVRTIHEMGIKVIYCCANDHAKIKTLAEADVDYILTDDVRLCRDALNSMQQKQ